MKFESRSKTLQERVSELIAPGPGCWEWKGSRTRSGRPVIGYHGAVKSPMRVMYELWHGEAVPERCVVEPSCGVMGCVRPTHLFIMSKRVHIGGGRRRFRREAA